MSIGQQAMVRRPQYEEEKREIAFYVRAKTGPGRKDWSPVGVVFERRDGRPGFTMKLNTLPFWKDWTGEMVLVPPFVEDEETAGDPPQETPRQRRKPTEPPISS